MAPPARRLHRDERLRGLRKERNLRRDRRVSICVDDGYRYVTISGEVELIDNQETAQADISALANRYLGPQQAERMIDDVFAKRERVSIILPMTKIYERGLAGGETFRRAEEEEAG